jgi:hypothetical protein
VNCIFLKKILTDLIMFILRKIQAVENHYRLDFPQYVF